MRLSVLLLLILILNFSLYGPGCIDAINTYYKRPDIPLGAWKGQNRDRENYTRRIALNNDFPNDIVSKGDVPDAVTLYRSILSGQPDNSVVIISVGHLMNLTEMLAEKALVKSKVNRVVVMGGRFNPSGCNDWNLSRNRTSRVYNATFKYFKLRPVKTASS